MAKRMFETCGTDPVSYRKWGSGFDDKTIEQMDNACSLPITVAGALMPDAHMGYGLPIGGVLAVKGSVIPYAVGMDIACRMKLTVFDVPVDSLTKGKERLMKALESETCFGVGVGFKIRKQHDVMDEDWNVSPVTRELKDKAWEQLGSSGAGNHFVEFGILNVGKDDLGLKAGDYLALLSHGGSRGTGAEVCTRYSKWAREAHPDLSGGLKELAWLDLTSERGHEYWQAMQLMGRYSAANHGLIHAGITRNLGFGVLADIENHHNFAWKERHFGEDVVVHRKGATPASLGVAGVIPGSMLAPGYVVRGKGNVESMNSAAHGAGRKMSRSAALRSFKWTEVKRVLEENGVTVLTAGLDEAPMAYKDIDMVMAAQADLVEPVAKFLPRIVKMAPPERWSRRKK